MRAPSRTALAAGTAVVLAGTIVAAAAAPASAARLQAVCSNASSDAATVQAVIAASKTGDEIVISGQCLVTKTIVLAGGRAYRGDSRSTTLTEAPGANLAAVVASDSWAGDWTSTGLPVTLRDLTVDAAKAGNPTGGDGIVIRSWNSTLENLDVRNARAVGLRITSLSRNGVHLTNTQVNGTIRDLRIDDSGKQGVYGEDPDNAVTDWTLADTWIAGSGSDAVRLDNSAGWVVERNHVYGVGGAGLNLKRLAATTVAENYIEDFATQGIAVTVQGDAASSLSANKVFQFSGTGTTLLAVTGVNYGTGHLAVTGNVLRGAGTGIGLSYQRGGNALTVTSSGNDVADVTTARSVGSGVVLSAGV